MDFIKKKFRKKIKYKDGIVYKSINLDKTLEVTDFYDKNPFPNFYDFQNKRDLIKIIDKNEFLKDLKEYIGFNKKFIEVGSGTSQLSLALASGTNNMIVALDPTLASLKLGKDFVDNNGKVILNTELTLNPNKPKSYAYCSDTQYEESIVPIIKGVDVLYHESTFLEEHSKIALKTKHSTAAQAAIISKLSNSKKLILGHFSTRYSDFSKFIDEAKNNFENVELAYDGKIIEF